MVTNEVFEIDELIVGRCCPMGGGVYIMKRYDPRFLLVLGMAMDLKEVQAREVRGKLLVFQEILLETIIKESDMKGLQKAANAAQQVLALIKPVIEDDAESVQKNSTFFNAWKNGLFIPVLEHFQSALSLDIDSLHIFVLEKKRGYAVETLLSGIEDVLSEADRGLLSDFARDNMQEAGACLAFHRFTACGYHMARAVEDVARRYNFAVTGHPSPYKDRNNELRHRSLAQIAEDLQNVLNNWKHTEEPRLLSLIVPTLRNFCRIYRTPLSHADPELKELDPNDAEIAFGHAITAVSNMLEDGRAGGQHFKSEPQWR